PAEAVIEKIIVRRDRPHAVLPLDKIGVRLTHPPVELNREIVVNALHGHLPGRHTVVPAVPDRLRVFPAASIAEGDGRVLGVKIETFAEDPKVPFVTRVSRDRASVHLISVERDQDVTLFREKDPPFLVTALPLAVHREPRRRDRPASGRLKRPDARVNSITDPARL